MPPLTVGEVVAFMALSHGRSAVIKSSYMPVSMQSHLIAFPHSDLDADPCLQLLAGSRVWLGSIRMQLSTGKTGQATCDGTKSRLLYVARSGTWWAEGWLAGRRRGVGSDSVQPTRR